MVRYCAVYGCFQSSKHNKNVRFFNFPSDERRCKHWIKAIGRNDLGSKDLKTLNKCYCVCELHFAESDCYKRFLRGDAVPTLQLPQLEEPTGTSKYTQTDEISPEEICEECTLHSSHLAETIEISPEIPCTLKSSHLAETVEISPEILSTLQSSHLAETVEISPEIPSILQSSYLAQTCKGLSDDTPRKRKLQLELQSESKKQRLLETVNENIKCAKETDMPPLLKKMVDAQKALKRNSQGNRYDQEYITFALNMYFASPAAYRVLSETLCLPSLRTLRRRVAFSISTKFDENVIKCLQSKSRTLSESEKYCVICADEMSLKRHLDYQINKDKIVGFHEIDEKQSKEIATRAFVVMARGIFSNWKQPLAFCFLGPSKNCEELSMWLDNIIGKMIEIGFNVCAFTSNQGSKFINISKSKCVSPDQPFFFVNGKKIYHIFDVPHLIKSLRNNLMKYDFVYQDDDDGSEQVASWDVIEKIYEIEKTRNYKIAYKLTESHIRPNSSEKMHVKYATQVISKKVAVTICALIELGKLEEKCMGTTKLIEVFNDTFDILNSSTINNDYQFKKAFHQAQYQKDTLDRAQRILTSLRVINHNNGKDVTNMMKFINGFMQSIKAISCLAHDLKTAGHDYLFTRRLSLDPIENFFGQVRQQVGNSREPSAIRFVTAFKKLFMASIIQNSEYANCADDLNQLLMSVGEAQSSLTSKESVSMELPQRVLQVGTSDYRFELPKENAFTYVCGYLLKKVYDHHDCKALKNYIKSIQQVDENNRFTYFYLPEDFKQYIREIDSISQDHFINCDFYHIGNEILIKTNDIVYNLPCACFPLEFLKTLFVRFRIFNVMRHNNRNFKDKSFKTKHFTVSHL